MHAGGLDPCVTIQGWASWSEPTPLSLAVFYFWDTPLKFKEISRQKPSKPNQASFFCFAGGASRSVQKKMDLHSKLKWFLVWNVSTTYIHTCMHACMHACIHTCMHACMHAYMHTCIHAYMHTCIHAYMHTCIHAYMHTSIHPYIHPSIHPYIHTGTYPPVK